MRNYFSKNLDVLEFSEYVRASGCLETFRFLDFAILEFILAMHLRFELRVLSLLCTALVELFEFDLILLHLLGELQKP